MKRSSILHWILLFTSMSLIGLFIVWAQDERNEFFRLQEPEVTIEVLPHQQATAKYLQPQVLKVAKGIVGANIWQVGLRDLQAQLWQQNWFSNVKIERRFPNRIHLHLSLEPVALLVQDKRGGLRAMNWQGELLTQLPATQLPPAPVLYNTEVFKDASKRKKLLSLLQQVPQIGVLRWDNIASVDLQQTTGLALELIDEGAVVYLGDDDLKSRSLQVLRVTEYLKNQKQKARVIDASFAKKVLVRPRKGS